MLDKLRMALILCIIGAASGLGIVAVNSFTEDIIEQNRIREELEIYFDLYGLEKPASFDRDDEPRDIYCRWEAAGYDSERNRIGEIHTYCVDDDRVHERAEIFDKEGNFLGKVFRVDHTNTYGLVVTLVALDAENEIVEVRIARHENTPNYARRIIDNHLEPFQGQDINDVSFYDGRTGATSTYGSIIHAVNATADNVVDDRALTDYRVFYPEAESYERVFDYTLGCIDARIAVYDGDDELLGHVYPARYANDHEEIALNIAISEGIFKGVRAARPDDRASEELLQALEKYEELDGSPIGEVEVDFDETAYDPSINRLVTQAIIRCQESDHEREMREFFLWSHEQDETADIDHDILQSYQAHYDEENDLIGHVYYGEYDTSDLTDAYDGGIMEVAVAVFTDGTISSVHLLSSEESDFAVRTLEENIRVFFTRSEDMDEDELADAFSGSTTSATGLNAIVEAALDYEDAREGD